MTGFETTTVNEFGSDALLPRRKISVGDTTVETPAVATLPGKLQADQEYHPDGRGVSELYATAGGSLLDQAVDNPKQGKLWGRLQRDHEKVEEGLSVAFVEYTESSTLLPSHARALIRSTRRFTDILTVPLVPKQIDRIGETDEVGSEAWQTVKGSVETYLKEADALDVAKPVMGLLPNLERQFVDDLIGLYTEYGVNAYVVDFDKTQPTADAQLENVVAMMQNVARRGVEEYTLFYALNPSRGRGWRHPNIPAADIASMAIGFDIIGRRHRSLNAPESVFGQQGGDEEETFRLFIRQEWVYEDIPLSELPDRFPERSSFDGEQVAKTVKRQSSNTKYRLQAAVNAEQQAIASREVRTALDSAEAFEVLRSKDGITDRAESGVRRVKRSFEQAREQSSLDEF